MANKKAKGMVGILLRGGRFSDEGTGKITWQDPIFRIYDSSKPDGFTDYDVWHDDMKIQILDEDAEVKGEGTDAPYIDHSDRTLGHDGKGT